MDQDRADTKNQQIAKLFEGCNTAEQKYLKIIDLGRKLPKMDPVDITEENRVHGCQSRMYVKTKIKEGDLHFTANSDALISAGLAALLLRFYDLEPAEFVLRAEPVFLDQLHIRQSLTPGRANGLFYLNKKIKQDALKFLMHL